MFEYDCQFDQALFLFTILRRMATLDFIELKAQITINRIEKVKFIICSSNSFLLTEASSCVWRTKDLFNK